jgi:putative ABC transport system permease protein
MSQASDVIKAELMKDPSVVSIGLTSNLPGDQTSVEGVVPQGADPNAQFPSFRVLTADDGFLQTLQIPLLQGRGFSRAFNDSSSFVVNKAALKALNIESNPIGIRITNQTRNITGPIIGVVDDYHFASLHNAVDPMVMQYQPQYSNYLIVKINSGDIQKIVTNIETTLKSIAPSNLFSYTFVEDRWNSQYKEEAKMNVLFNTFSVFMIVISCIGLFGLSSITIQTRRKEIGIRKVVGASIPTIVRIMSKDFVILVVIGSIIGLPLAWYAMDSWLSGFAYKTNITADVFIISVVACVLIAFGSVIFNALRAAHTNPVDSLRSE